MKKLLTLLCLGLGLLFSGACSAQDAYPTKQIRVIIPFAAGGPADIAGRQIVAAMSPIIGQTMFVENIPGAAGIVGTKAGASAPPDGYTVLLGGTGTHGTNEFLYPSLPYDAQKDFVPVMMIYKAINVFVVPTDSPIKTLGDLIEAAKKNPGQLNYGIGTIGSSSHLAFEKFKTDSGINMASIPYKGMVAAFTDMMGGRIQVMPNDVISAYAQIVGGKLRPIAVTSAERLSFLTEVPTVAESGFPGFEAVGWGAFFVPAGTPQAIVDKIAQAGAKAFATPALQESLAKHQIQLMPSTPASTAQYAMDEKAKWAKVIKDAQIKLE